MNTKLSVFLLSSLSLFMSVGAYAVSKENSADYINWSYATGGDTTVSNSANTTPDKDIVLPEKKANVPCTVGCDRPDTSRETALTMTYEDEADLTIPELPLPTMAADDETMFEPQPPAISVRDKWAQQTESVIAAESAPLTSTSVETYYTQSAPKVQYPITRQYPISVQYPVTVQRDVTVEQPVVMQQPVIVRRPVVMQQAVTVQRQPAYVQAQPMVMQQQPTYIQQQPVVVQAPAGSVDMMLQQLGIPATQQMPATFQMQPMPTQSVMPMMPAAPQQQAVIPTAAQPATPDMAQQPAQQPIQQPVPQALPQPIVPQMQMAPVAAPVMQMPITPYYPQSGYTYPIYQ